MQNDGAERKNNERYDRKRAPSCEEFILRKIEEILPKLFRKYQPLTEKIEGRTLEEKVRKTIEDLKL